MKKQLSQSKKSWDGVVTKCLTLMMLLLFGTMNKAAAQTLPAVKYMAYNTATGKMEEKTLAADSYIPVTGTITSDEVYLLSPGWYVVVGNTSVNKSLFLMPSVPVPIGARRNVTAVPNGEVNIILTDGAKLTVAGGLDLADGIDLNIYAQSGNTGTATFNSTTEGLFIPTGGVLSVHGGVLNASLMITCNGIFNVYSGTLNANFEDITGDSGVNGAVNLSWARGTESYFSNFYGKAEDSGTVTLLKNMYYNDGSKYVKVAAGSVDKKTIAGKTLVPGMELTLAAASSTWYNDSDYDWTLPTGLTAYAVAFDEAGAVTTTALSYIPAKTGVLLEGTASTSYFLTPYTGTTSTVTSLLTTGTPTAYKDYIYDGSDFVLYSGTEALTDGKCYLPGTAAKTVTATTVDAIKIVTPTNGTISAALSGATVTLTATPSGGYFITAADIVVTKTAPNGKALARGLAEKLVVTAGTVDATGKGTYTFTLPEGYGAVVEATFTAQTDISGATVTLDWTAKDYKPGTVQKAAVTKVTLNGTDLSATNDYGVTYNETAWINQGTYTINVTGKGKYKGTATTTFTINALQISAIGTGANQIAVVFKGTNSSSITFDGAAHGVDLMVGGKAAAVVDLSVALTDATGATVTECSNAGSYLATVTTGVSGNIVFPDDRVTASLTITPKVVSTTATDGATATLEIELTGIPTGGYVYDGTAKQPGVKVYDLTVSPKAEVPPTEYTVGYAVNTNAGTAIVTITDKEGGNYTVSGSTTFTIAPLTITDFKLTGIPEGGFVYDGTAKTVGVAYNNGTEDITISDSEYNMTYKLGTADATELKNAGTYTVTVTDKEGGNYIITGSKELTIAPKPVSTTATGGAAATLTITLDPTEATYTGKDLTPTVTVKDGETEISNTEYTVAFTLNSTTVEKCINAGTYTVTLTDVTGGNYTVSGSTTFTINPKPVSTTIEGGAAALTIILNPTEATYTGADLTPTVTVKDGETEISNTEYTVAFTLNSTTVEKCINAGTYTVTLTDVTGGNYTVSGSTTFTINPKPVSTTATGSSTATLEIELTNIPVGGYVYGGTEKEPGVKVYDLTVSPKAEVPSTEYTVEYANNTNAGEATVTIKDVADGNYTVSGSTTFEIGKASLTATADDQSITFNDAAPTYTISYTGFVNGETAAVLGEKIPTATCTYQAGDDAGEYEITVSGGEAANYELSYQKGKLTVAPKKISTGGTGDNKLTIGFEGADGNPSRIAIFDGLVKEVRVMAGGNVLTKGVDYLATIWQNAVSVAQMRDAGLYEVSIKSVENANYVFDANAQLTIEQRTVTNSGASATMEIELTNVPEGGYVYDGTEKKPGVKVYDVSVTPKAEVDEKEYTVGYTNNTNAGTATVTITDKDGGNYAVSGSTTFKIAPKSIRDFTLTGIPEGGYVYDGTKKEPGVEVYDGTTLVDAAEYTVSYKQNVNAGTATVTIKDVKGGNYTVSGSTTFTIAPKPVTDFNLTGIPEGGYVYDGTAKKPGVEVHDGTTLVDAKEYKVSYKDNVNAGTATVTLTDKAGGNYIVSGGTTFIIAPKSITDFNLTGIPEGGYVYDGTAKKPGVEVHDGTTLVDAKEYTVDYKDNVNVGTATVTLTDVEGGNYIVSGTATFTINLPSFTDASGVVFQYEVLADGTVKIIGVKVPDGVTDVDIPSKIGDKVVSAIGKEAFKGNTGVKNISIPTTAKPLTIDVSAFTTGAGGDKEPDVIVPSGMADKYAEKLLEALGPNLVTLLNFVADHKYKTVSSAYSILIPVDAGIDVYKVVGNYIGNDSKLTSVALKAYQNLQKVTVKGVQYYRLDPTAFTSIATTRAGEPVDPPKRAVRCVIGRGPSFASAAHDPAIAVYRPYAPYAPIFKLRLVPVKAHAIGARKAVNEPDPDADNLLYPVLNPTHFPSGMIWILKDDAFYAILDDGTETPAGVSVLMMPNGTSGARIISIEEDNSEATGISDATRLNDKGEMINDHWYTLDGRKLDVAPKTKGVYIHNGVKVVVK